MRVRPKVLPAGEQADHLKVAWALEEKAEDKAVL
jgi:hypothetical protein